MVVLTEKTVNRRQAIVRANTRGWVSPDSAATWRRETHTTDWDPTPRRAAHHLHDRRVPARTARWNEPRRAVSMVADRRRCVRVRHRLWRFGTRRVANRAAGAAHAHRLRRARSAALSRVTRCCAVRTTRTRNVACCNPGRSANFGVPVPRRLVRSERSAASLTRFLLASHQVSRSADRRAERR